MSVMYSLAPIRIGVVANEPMRLEGLTSIFENHAKPGETPLLPIVGTLEEHLENESIEYVLIDWSSSSKKLGVLEGIRRKRPNPAHGGHRSRQQRAGHDGHDHRWRPRLS